MPHFLLDTDHLTLFRHRHANLVQRIISQPARAVGISAVTVEEVLRGRLAVVARPRAGTTRVQAYAELIETVRLVMRFPILPYDQAADNQFQQLVALRLRIGTQDLRIAAVALANHLTVLTRNRRDFGRVPGLLIEDWTR